MGEEKEKLLTRKDVLRLIKENGDTAEGLNLSNRRFVEAIDLSGLELQGINLSYAHLFRANFNGSNLDVAIMLGANLGYATFNPLDSKAASLQKVDLRHANLHDAEFREADLSVAQFQETHIQGGVSPSELQDKLFWYLPAILERTDFRGANLFLADFSGCHFYGTKLEGARIRGADIYNAHLEDVEWGSYKIGEENKKDYYSAQSIYRRLKQWYTNAGMYDIAGKFYYREKEAGRKGTKRWNNRAAGWLMWALFGHGERWWNILFWIVAVIFGLAAAYHFWGSFSSSSFWDILYYSAVSFTALGYGQWAPQPTGWAKGMGAAEAIIGVFMMALLLVTFVRKWTR